MNVAPRLLTHRSLLWHFHFCSCLHLELSNMQTHEHASADLMAIGQHCAWPDCGQLDFLPFRCGCGQTFCLDHRSAAAHKCRLAAADCKQVIVCPICAQGVELKATDDPNVVFDRHQQAGCDPSNYARVHKKPRCPVQGCKEKLTSINTYTCKDCRTAVCLRHRLSVDHKCPGPTAAASAAAAAGQRQAATAAASAALTAAAAAGRSFGAKASSFVSDLRSTASAAASSARSKNHRQQQPADPSNTVYGSAHRRQQEWQLRQQQQQRGTERCPQCSAVFADVQQLIQHVEAVHSNNAADMQRQQQQLLPRQQGGGGGGGAGGGEVFVCPRCSTRFSDAVLLVSHSESCGRGQGNCVLC